MPTTTTEGRNWIAERVLLGNTSEDLIVTVGTGSPSSGELGSPISSSTSVWGEDNNISISTNSNYTGRIDISIEYTGGSQRVSAGTTVTEVALRGGVPGTESTYSNIYIESLSGVDFPSGVTKAIEFTVTIDN
mgnify:CR=1 FL=1